jgi:hypothetical protein
MTRVRRFRVVIGALLVAGVPSLAAAHGNPVPIEERARGAARVVVAVVAETTARYERNEFGDELIVTCARLRVEEAIKGPAAPVTLALEGGTVDGVTLRVSRLPTLGRGERAVFFLEPGRAGEFRPHLRGRRPIS